MGCFITICIAVILSGVFADREDSIIERWRKLPKTKRKMLLSAYKRFRSLPEERRREVIEQWRKFRQLPEKERLLILRKWREFKVLPKERRRLLIQRYRRWRRLVRPLMNSLPEEKRRELLLMSPHKRLTEFRKLFKKHSLRLFRRIAEHLPEDEVRALLALPDDEFLKKMRELIRSKRRILYENMLKTIPRHMQLRLAQMPKPKRQEALRTMVADELKRKTVLLKKAGFDTSVISTLPFHARLFAVNGAYRRLTKKISVMIKDAVQSIKNELIRRRVERALLSGRYDEIPEPFRSTDVMTRFLRLPAQLQRDSLRLLKRKRVRHPPYPLPPLNAPHPKDR